MTKKLIEIASEIVITQASRASMTTAEISSALRQVFSTLNDLQKAESGETEITEEWPPSKVLAPINAIQKKKVMLPKVRVGLPGRELVSERSFEKITIRDLQKLAYLARLDRETFFNRYPEKKNKLICVALCQGAALHFINCKNGVKDFDVWSFYKKENQVPDFHPKRIAKVDFGESKFGVHPNNKRKGILGRRVDLIGRSIEYYDNESPVSTIHRYLEEAKTPSAQFLREKAVVLLEPSELLGHIVWPK